MARRRPEIVWSEPAEADLDAIVGFVAMDRPNVAVELALRFRAMAASLDTLARRGRIPPELKPFGIGSIREIVSPPWRLFYETLRSRITILALIDGRRDLEETLTQRLLRPR